jgi:hypothetical protein
MGVVAQCRGHVMASGIPAESSATNDAGSVPKVPADGTGAAGGPAFTRGRIRLVLVVLAVAGLAAAGVATRSVSGANGISASDRSLTLMQRMGPPPAMIGLYQLLAADTVAIRNSSTGGLISTGLYVGDMLKPATLPGFLDGLPGNVKRLIALGASNSYLAYFVAPDSGIDSRRVQVQTPWGQLAGAVVRISHLLGLAAVVTVVSQGQLNKFFVPLHSYVPAGQMAMLVVHRNPAVYARSAGFVLTSGGISRGHAWCDLPVTGTSAGSPVAYVSPAGATWLLGLAMPSSVHGRCSVIGSWTIAQFVSLAVESGTGGAP